MYSIYTLSDPRTNEVRYVGCTLDAKRRFADHVRNTDCNAAKKAWINELKTLELLPVLTVIEEGLREPDCFIREAYWIEQYIEQGAPLTSTRRSKKDASQRVHAVHYVFTQGSYEREVSLGREVVLLKW